MKKGEDLSVMYKIANYYYMDNLSQQEIADRLGVSRSQVSRLLILARERGLVEININMPSSESVEKMQRLLKKDLGLEKVYIFEADIPDNTGANTDVLNRELGTFAATIIPRLLSASKVIGVGRGATVYNTASALPSSDESSNRIFVPIVGNTGVRHRHQQTSAIVSMFADRMCAEAYFINSPICFKNYGDELNSSWYRELCGFWERLDGAIFSVGDYSDSFIRYIDDLPKELYEFAFSSKGEGEIIGQTFSSTSESNGFGNTIGDYVYVGLPIDRLKGIKNTICIAGGEVKVNAILSAAKLGYFKTLITDSMTAAQIINAYSK